MQSGPDASSGNKLHHIVILTSLLDTNGESNHPLRLRYVYVANTTVIFCAHAHTEFSPYAQKTKLLLEAAGVSYQRCDQPIVLPRKDLEELGITYRRIPVLAIGKDVYCDSSLIFDIVLDKMAKKQVPTSLADKAWEAWGHETFYGSFASHTT